MRTRKVDSVEPARTPKKKPPSAKKSAGPTQTTPSSAGIKAESSPADTSAEVKSEFSLADTSEPNRASTGRMKKIRPEDRSPSITPASKSRSPVETATSSHEATQLVKVIKPVRGKKVVRKVVKKVIKKKVPTLSKDTSGCVPEIRADEKTTIEETAKENVLESSDIVESVGNHPTTGESSQVDVVQVSVLDNKKTSNAEKLLNKEAKVVKRQKHLTQSSGNNNSEPIVSGKTPLDAQESMLLEEEDSEGGKEEQTKTKNESMAKQDDASIEEADNEKIEGISDQEVHEEFVGEEFADDDEPDDVAVAETLEEEQIELNVAARERKARKEREIFVGGLDRDAVEEDVRKVFKYAGEVVEVRMHMDPATKKNKGFAFVQFATKEQASYALSEMKNPVIHGKRCGTASIEGDDTLFLGNICNTWTKEAINQKLKDYGIEGVENITMVADPRNEGLSRGFVFVEFSCHAEALLAYKRLQKPDVVFGHSERTVKVAFAEPQREPDPEIMAQVKSVFIDGLPPHWDEDRVRENFKVFGEITKILLARNMSTAKRKDFGFVDFNTHEDAVSCVEGVNRNGLNDGNLKVTVRARLSNPLPKMQAIKGGMCGGYRIGYGRGFDRGAQPFSRANLQYGRHFNPRPAGRGGRVGSFEHEYNVPQRPFYGRQNSGRGGRWGFGGAYQSPEPARPYLGRLRHGDTDRSYGGYESYSRPTYSFEEGYTRSYMGRHLDDSFPYDDVAHGIKRPYYMMDSDLAEPSRSRHRMDLSGPTGPNPRTRYQDNLRADGGFLPQNYYGSGYGSGAYSADHRGDDPFGRDFYY